MTRVGVSPGRVGPCGHGVDSLVVRPGGSYSCAECRADRDARKMERRADLRRARETALDTAVVRGATRAATDAARRLGLGRVLENAVLDAVRAHAVVWHHDGSLAVRIDDRLDVVCSPTEASGGRLAVVPIAVRLRH